MGKEKNKEAKPQKSYLYLAYKGKEYLWLAFTIVSIILAVYEIITRKEGEGNEGALYFVGLTILSGLFYSFNRYRRLKWEKRDADEAKEKN